MRTPLILLLLFASIQGHSQYRCQDLKATAAQTGPSINNNGKSDTLDILHYHIFLDATSVVSNDLSGATDVRFTPKINGVSRMSLDLLELQIDSITPTSVVNSYSYNDTIISVQFGTTLNIGDTLEIRVHYHGNPQGDATGWGGWHSNNPYFYNLGVGFGADPHTYGRAWFPCFDNFVEKSTYSFEIKTEGGRKAYCNGLRIQTDSLGGDTIVSHWNMTDPIPTYLASVAISNYQEMVSDHNGLPVWILARANDTNKVKGSFVHVTDILDAFVDDFGPFHWQKLGYALTVQGAMEHATSIHYPRHLVQGNLSGEDIIAHEMAHHWWGNLVTCESDAHMWINEGLAEYSSQLYEEKVYNKETYLETVQDNAALVIQYASVGDGGFWPLVNLPHNLTYGVHTYQKGAMVGHNLRGYLGDSLFFHGMTQLLNDHAFGTLNTLQFRDALALHTGYNLHSFFNDWILQPGYPQFGIDSLSVTPLATMDYKVDVRIRQGLRGTTTAFSDVPLTLTYHYSNGQSETKSFFYEDKDTLFSTQVMFDPVYVTVNEEQHILTGTTVNELDIHQPGSYDLERALIRLDVKASGDTSRIRAEHHWSGPGGKNPNHFRISTSRYWRITGRPDAGFDSEATVFYTSRTQTGSLDTDLLIHGEDSLILLYRQNGNHPWLEYPYYQKNTLGSANNGYGRMDLSKVLTGEYVFANGTSTLSEMEYAQKNLSNFILYPNPASKSITLELRSKNVQLLNYRLYNEQGQIFQQGVWKAERGDNKMELDVHDLKPAKYFINIQGHIAKFMVIR